MEYLLPVLRGVLSPSGGDILCASVCRILRRHPELHPLPGIQAAVDVPPERSGAVHVFGELDYHRLKDNEPLRVPAALLDYHADKNRSDVFLVIIVDGLGHLHR